MCLEVTLCNLEKYINGNIRRFFMQQKCILLKEEGRKMEELEMGV